MSSYINRAWPWVNTTFCILPWYLSEYIRDLENGNFTLFYWHLVITPLLSRTITYLCPNHIKAFHLFIRFKIVRLTKNRVWITNISWKSNFTKVSNTGNDILQYPKIANICQSAVASEYTAGWRGRCSNWKSHAMCRLYESNIRQTLYIKYKYSIKWLKQ